MPAPAFSAAAAPARLLRRSAAIQDTLFCLRRPYSARSRQFSRVLASVCSKGRGSTASLVSEIERWAYRNGGDALSAELRQLVRELRRRRLYAQALEVSEWTKYNGHVKFTPAEHAVHIDLLGQVHGLKSAITYFDNLSESNKTERTYGALLNCYVRERLVAESLSHMKKMKELGYINGPLPYNGVMCLYTHRGQHDKVPSVLTDMKAHGIIPDLSSYKLCINSFGKLSDINGMEKSLEELEHQPQIVVDWNTYAVVAKFYIEAQRRSQAFAALKKAEERMDKRYGGCYNHLISLYGTLGSKLDAWRLWELQRVKCKRFLERDYTTMLSVLMKLGELEQAEAVLREWESSNDASNFCVPNAALKWYIKLGLFKKAESLLDELCKKGKLPPSSSWGIMAHALLENGEMDKACECMKKALRAYIPDAGWEPSLAILKRILEHISSKGDLKELEVFVGMVKAATPLNRELSGALARAAEAAGREADGFLKMMEADGVSKNEKKQLFGSFVKMIVGKADFESKFSNPSWHSK